MEATLKTSYREIRFNLPAKSYYTLNQIKFRARESRSWDVERTEQIDKRINELTTNGRISEPAESLRPMEPKKNCCRVLNNDSSIKYRGRAESATKSLLHYLNDRHSEIELAREETSSWILNRHVAGVGRCRDF